MCILVPAPVRALRAYKPCITKAGDGSRRTPRETCAADYWHGADAVRRPRFVILVYPRMSLADFRAARTILHLMGGEVHVAWKTCEAVVTDREVTVTPTTSFAQCPENPDVLFIPGASDGAPGCIDDRQVLAFIADRGARSKYVTAVCSGSLLLDAAGLHECRRHNARGKSR